MWKHKLQIAPISVRFWPVEPIFCNPMASAAVFAVARCPDGDFVMNRITALKPVKAFGILVAAGLSFASFSANAAGPIGSLTVENDVTVVTPTGSIKLDGGYSYFGGDNIITGEDGVAGLSLDNQSRIYLGNSSEGKLDQVDGRYIVELSSGSLGFTFSGGQTFKIMASDMTVEAGSDTGISSGMVSIDQNGEVSVQSVSGDLQVVSTGGQRQLVNSGEAYAMQQTDSGLVKTQATTSTTALIVGGAVVAGAIVVANDDDDPASPN